MQNEHLLAKSDSIRGHVVLLLSKAKILGKVSPPSTILDWLKTKVGKFTLVWAGLDANRPSNSSQRIRSADVNITDGATAWNYAVVPRELPRYNASRALPHHPQDARVAADQRWRESATGLASQPPGLGREQVATRAAFLPCNGLQSAQIDQQADLANGL